MKKNIHPLKAWIEANHTNLKSFADAHGIGFRALYKHVHGDQGKMVVPRIKTMMAVARATNRQVSVENQVEWYQEQEANR